MTKSKHGPAKTLPRLNQALALLVKAKGTQISVANALGISSQSLGYYIKGRTIPAHIIESWERVYNQNLIAISKLDLGSDLETIISKQTEGHDAKASFYEKQPVAKGDFDKAVEQEVISVELWKQLQKDHAIFEKELDRAWSIIDRLLPQSKTQTIKRINTDKGE